VRLKAGFQRFRGNETGFKEIKESKRQRLGAVAAQRGISGRRSCGTRGCLPPGMVRAWRRGIRMGGVVDRFEESGCTETRGKLRVCHATPTRGDDRTALLHRIFRVLPHVVSAGVPCHIRNPQAAHASPALTRVDAGAITSRARPHGDVVGSPRGTKLTDRGTTRAPRSDRRFAS
jgi:hypothetical protein